MPSPEAMARIAARQRYHARLWGIGLGRRMNSDAINRILRNTVRLPLRVVPCDTSKIFVGITEGRVTYNPGEIRWNLAVTPSRHT